MRMTDITTVLLCTHPHTVHTHTTRLKKKANQTVEEEEEIHNTHTHTHQTPAKNKAANERRPTEARAHSELRAAGYVKATCFGYANP